MTSKWHVTPRMRKEKQRSCASCNKAVISMHVIDLRTMNICHVHPAIRQTYECMCLTSDQWTYVMCILQQASHINACDWPKTNEHMSCASRNKPVISMHVIDLKPMKIAFSSNHSTSKHSFVSYHIAMFDKRWEKKLAESCVKKNSSQNTCKHFSALVAQINTNFNLSKILLKLPWD